MTINKTVKIITGATILFLIIISIKIETIPQYQLTQINQQDIEEKVEFTSKLRPYKISKIDLGSYDNIKKVLVKPGDKVKKGQIIALLDDTDEKRAYDNAWKSYNSAIISRNKMYKLDDAFTDYVDTSYKTTQSLTEIIDLLKENVPEENAENIPDNLDDIINADLTNLKTSYTSLVSASQAFGSIGQSAVNLAYASLQNAKANLEKTKIKSPINGTVLVATLNNYNKATNNNMFSSLASFSDLLGTSGMDMESLFSSDQTFSQNNFTPEEQNIIYIADESHWYVFAQFVQDDIVKLKKGQDVRLYIKNLDTQLRGKVQTIYPIPININAEEPNYKVKIKIEDTIPNNILPGMLVNGFVIIQTKKDVPTVPLEAVYYDKQSKPYVKVLTDKGVQNKPIKLGIQTEEYVEILEGVNESDQIVLREDKPKKQIKIRFLH